MTTRNRDNDREAELEAAIERIVEENLKNLKPGQTPSMPGYVVEGTPPELQNVEYEDDTIQEHIYFSGYILIIAATVVIAAVWLFLRFRERLAELRLECCDHSFLKELASIVALPLAVPFFIWIWRSAIPKLEAGSRIDLGKRMFVFWDGPLPRVEHNIELDKIVRVNLLASGEGENGDIELVEATGTKITVRGICVKSTEDWGRALKSEFPHIRIKAD